MYRSHDIVRVIRLWIENYIDDEKTKYIIIAGIVLLICRIAYWVMTSTARNASKVRRRK